MTIIHVQEMGDRAELVELDFDEGEDIYSPQDGEKASTS